MVLIIVNYTKPIEVIDELLTEHRKFTNNACKEGKFIFTGPRKTRTGGFVVTGLSAEEAKEFVKDDPFYFNQAADYEFIEFTPVTYDDRFACFIDK